MPCPNSTASKPEDLNTRMADRLVELAYALEDNRLPVGSRIEFVKRELGFAAKELLDARGVDSVDGSRS